MSVLSRLFRRPLPGSEFTLSDGTAVYLRPVTFRDVSELGKLEGDKIASARFLLTGRVRDRRGRTVDIDDLSILDSMRIVEALLTGIEAAVDVADPLRERASRLRRGSGSRER